ncbi:MAG: alpha/beta fold hydrolase, partial [Verrucomicrobiota bacterium]
SRGMGILPMSCWISGLLIVAISGCAPISKYPAPPRVREGALAQAGQWVASARRSLDERAVPEKCLASLRIALADNSPQARDIANVALGRFLESNFDGASPHQTDFTGPDGVVYHVRVAAGPGDWPEALLNGLEPIRPTRTRASAPLQWEGWGVPVIGVSRPDRTAQPFAPRQGYRLPVTVVADMSMRGATCEARCETTIRFLNPEITKSVSIAGKQRPVAGDLYAPNLATFRRGNPLVLSLRWLFQVDRFSYPTSLIFMQPYDPKRIPVVLVHGLLSTPVMWAEVVNGLQADPEIRKNFQFWTFFYPTGQPIPISALDLRKDLRSAEARYPLPRGLVLVGHSMGGIIARAEASGSGGTALFDSIFGADAPNVAKRLEKAPLLRDSLIFERDKNVRRVVFVCVPHRGSNIALAGPVGFFASLIRLPRNIIGAVEEVADVVTTLDLRRPPTSIAGLSPRSPFLRALNARPIDVPHHTILGDRGRRNSPNSSDGVVPYSSGHLDTAESELVVPSDHGSFRHPAAIAEMRRILHEHLVSAGGAGAARAPAGR